MRTSPFVPGLLLLLLVASAASAAEYEHEQFVPAGGSVGALLGPKTPGEIEVDVEAESQQPSVYSVTLKAAHPTQGWVTLVARYATGDDVEVEFEYQITPGHLSTYVGYALEITTTQPARVEVRVESP